MLRSDIERVLRTAMEETNAQFSEEQVKCLLLAFDRLVIRMIEEALSTYRPPSGR